MPKINLKRFTLAWKAAHPAPPKPKPKPKLVRDPEIKELIKLMLTKGKEGHFKDIDPRELGANYDLIPTPSNTKYWIP